GNPKGIKDWPDLIKDDVQVVAPNPKTSGGARWAYLAAWAYATKASGGDEAKTRDFIKVLYQHVPVLDSGARGSTVTFTQKQLGDVELAWENDAILAQQQFGADQYDIVYPRARSSPNRRSQWSTRTSMHTAPARSRPNISTISIRPMGRPSRRRTTTARSTPIS